ncbi:MAG: hypothetical protein RMK97_10550 [Sutterellaceae bacterium]|nr:hypothetical protein [Burkholderiaceae bacterium]MCX7901632.1 hypothetical protein [Burkholderiaceae bacterium]MDW8430921.1 hypothetical protein [Sutterellaceae bacterium]
MPWRDDADPPAMRRLRAPARVKALEIATALLAKGIDKGQAIRIAIAKAKQWAEQRGLPVRQDDPR